MPQRRARVAYRPTGPGWIGETRRELASEFNPLYFQLDLDRLTPAELAKRRRNSRIIVAQQVVLGRLGKTEAKQVLLALGLT